MPVKKLLQQLTARLPELEWKMSKIDELTLKNGLSEEIFTTQLKNNPSLIIAAIYQDIKNLSAYTNGLGGYYLAKKIEQKINILVHLCQMKTLINIEEKDFKLQTISTYQQWIADIESHLDNLEVQKKALQTRIATLKLPEQSLLLSLAQELGIIEKNITLAQESLVRSRTFSK